MAETLWLTPEGKLAELDGKVLTCTTCPCVTTACLAGQERYKVRYGVEGDTPDVFDEQVECECKCLYTIDPLPDPLTPSAEPADYFKSYPMHGYVGLKRWEKRIIGTFYSDDPETGKTALQLCEEDETTECFSCTAPNYLYKLLYSERPVAECTDPNSDNAYHDNISCYCKCLQPGAAAEGQDPAGYLASYEGDGYTGVTSGVYWRIIKVGGPFVSIPGGLSNWKQCEAFVVDRCVACIGSWYKIRYAEYDASNLAYLDGYNLNIECICKCLFSNQVNGVEVMPVPIPEGRVASDYIAYYVGVESEYRYDLFGPFVDDCDHTAKELCEAYPIDGCFTCPEGQELYKVKYGERDPNCPNGVNEYRLNTYCECKCLIPGDIPIGADPLLYVVTYQGSGLTGTTNGINWCKKIVAGPFEGTDEMSAYQECAEYHVDGCPYCPGSWFILQESYKDECDGEDEYSIKGQCYTKCLYTDSVWPNPLRPGTTVDDYLLNYPVSYNGEKLISVISLPYVDDCTKTGEQKAREDMPNVCGVPECPAGQFYGVIWSDHYYPCRIMPPMQWTYTGRVVTDSGNPTCNAPSANTDYDIYHKYQINYPNQWNIESRYYVVTFHATMYDCNCTLSQWGTWQFGIVFMHPIIAAGYTACWGSKRILLASYCTQEDAQADLDGRS